MVLVLLAAPAHGLGLGRIEVHSHLNEPFSAKIPIIGADASYQDSLFVFLADPEQFKKMGVERRFILATLKFEVVQPGQSGPSHIDISSVQPIREPFLDILLELASPDGRLVQQYTVLLDPAASGGGDTHPVAYAYLPKAAPSADTTTHQAPVRADVEPEPVSEMATANFEEGGGNSPTVYGPVTETDTLWSLATSLRPDASVSVQQMMLALLRENPEAFLNGRLGGLKKGQMLRIPDLDEINAVTKAEAIAEVKRQSGE